MAYATFSYTPGGTDNLSRLRLMIGDHRGVAGTYATNALWVSNAQAIFTDEELNDLLIWAVAGGAAPAVGSGEAIMTATRLALQIRANREAFLAGVSGTTDTTDRPAALLNAMKALERLPIGLQDSWPATQTTTNDDIDNSSRTGDLEQI